MKDNKYRMLSLFEFSYADELPVRQIINICNQIQADGFDPVSEFDENTISSLLFDYNCNQTTTVNKLRVQCVKQNCEKKALRDNICKKHLLMNKKNVCGETACRNLKYKFHSGPKKEQLYDLCCFHRKRYKALYSLKTKSMA